MIKPSYKGSKGQFRSSDRLQRCNGVSDTWLDWTRCMDFSTEHFRFGKTNSVLWHEWKSPLTPQLTNRFTSVASSLMPHFPATFNITVIQCRSGGYFGVNGLRVPECNAAIWTDQTDQSNFSQSTWNLGISHPSYTTYSHSKSPWICFILQQTRRSWVCGKPRPYSRPGIRSEFNINTELFHTCELGSHGSALTSWAFWNPQKC